MPNNSLTYETIQKLFANSIVNQADYYQFVYNKLLYSGLPPYNSWHRMKAEEIEAEFTDVVFD